MITCRYAWITHNWAHLTRRIWLIKKYLQTLPWHNYLSTIWSLSTWSSHKLCGCATLFQILNECHRINLNSTFVSALSVDEKAKAVVHPKSQIKTSINVTIRLTSTQIMTFNWSAIVYILTFKINY